MFHYVENLKKLYPAVGGKYEFSLESFVIDRLDGNPKELARPAMLVIPGGGYGSCSEREAMPIAAAFAAKGFNCYVLYYSTVSTDPTGRFPDQLVQSAAAIDYIKSKATEHCTDSERISVCGFSAGGHLAGMISTLFNHESVKKAFPKKGEDYFRPYASVLSYPVISSDEKIVHLGSFINLTGDDKKVMKELSLEKCVTKKTPPAFIWHTMDDTCVDCRNSLVYATALKENGVKFELHVYPTGQHGLALANEVTSCGNKACENPLIAQWVDHAARFITKEI